MAEITQEVFEADGATMFNGTYWCVGKAEYSITGAKVRDSKCLKVKFQNIKINLNVILKVLDLRFKEFQ